MKQRSIVIALFTSILLMAWSLPGYAAASISALEIPDTIVAGETADGTVTLTEPAPAGGAAVDLFSTNTGIVRVPPTVTVPAGESSATFVVTAVNASTVSATVYATYGGAQRSVTVTVTPAPSTDPPTLNTLTVTPMFVVGGDTAQGEVTFTEPVAEDAVVALSSTEPSVASVPASVTVAAGASSAIFTVTTQPVSGADVTVVIGGSFGGVERSDVIDVTAPPPPQPELSSMSFSPSTVDGGAPATGTVTLAEPATDGAVVSLTSSHPDLVQVPSELVFSVDSASEAFPVTTQSTTASTDVTITATAGAGADGAVSGTLSVTPTSTPPESDTVEITNVKWHKCIFSVRATSTNPDAILTVHLAASNGVVLELTNLGGGKYAGERAFRPPGSDVPVDIVLRSNFGGSDPATVSDSRAGACRGGF